MDGGAYPGLPSRQGGGGGDDPGAWLLLPVSFSTALTGLVSITMVAAAIVGYCFLVGDRAAAKVLSKSEMRDCDVKQP